MKQLTSVVSALVLGVGIMSAAAPAHAKSVKDRLQRQSQRIRQGVRTGSLTRGEAEELRSENRALRNQTRHYRHSGGRFGRFERGQMQRELDAEHARIFREKHNGWFR